MDLSIFFAGTGGSIPTARRGLPALLVRRGADRILFDCGEGTQRQLVSSVGLTELTEVFLPHFHADHWLGLPGMLKTFDLRGRERPLAVYGPRGLRELIVLALRAAGRVRFELESDGTGGAILILTQSGLSRPQLPDVAAGWHTYLTALPAACDGIHTRWDSTREAAHRRRYDASLIS